MTSPDASSETLLRIAIVIGQLSHGGAERQTLILADGMRQRGEFVPIVFCLSSYIEPYGSMLTAANVEWYAPPNNYPKLFKLIWLVQTLQRARCSLVYGVLNIGNIYGGAVALLTGLPFVASIRNTDSTLPTAIRRLSGFFSKRARAVIANSNSCAVSLREDLGVQHKAVYVIPNAVMLAPTTLNARQTRRDQWQIPADACVIGTVANLKPQKRVEFFLQAAATLHELSPANTHFVWIGEGVERRRAEEMLSQFPGALAETIYMPGGSLQVADCLAAFDVFVLTSSYEGMPGALMEAMAAGLPCVACDVPGTRDILNSGTDETGILAEAHDPARFAAELSALLENPERRALLGANAQAYIHAHYGLPLMIERFSAVFRKVINLNVHPGEPIP